jgi:hypothetical protein
VNTANSCPETLIVGCIVYGVDAEASHQGGDESARCLARLVALHYEGMQAPEAMFSIAR